MLLMKLGKPKDNKTTAIAVVFVFIKQLHFY